MIVATALAAAVMALGGQAPAAAPPQDTVPREIRGSWSATSGARVFVGTWTATLDRDSTDEAQGTWALLDGRRIVLEGTWAATKTARGWRGAWSARVASRRGGGGDGRPAYSGTWQATIADASLKTLAEMLASTPADVTGTWRAGAASGAWRLSTRR